jgi:3-oxoacyl-[acyl-carrier protein] reductase
MKEQKMFRLDNKTAVVTGANGAIGSSIVKALINQGANVFLVGSVNSHQHLEEMTHSHAQVAGYLAIDLAESGFAPKVMAEAISKLGKVDILINCAGIAVDNLFLRISEQEWDSQINLNLKSSWEMTQAALKHMMQKRWGRVISISSVIGKVGNVGQTVYSTSKAALYGMSMSLAREVASRNITVNTVSPGFIESPMTEKLITNQEMKQNILGRIPVGRIGSPEEVAASVVYLASEEAAYITGIDLCISGGMWMG